MVRAIVLVLLLARACGGGGTTGGGGGGTSGGENDGPDAGVGAGDAGPPADAAEPGELLDPEARFEAARQEYEAAVAAVNAGRLEEGLAGFRRAHAMTGSPDILYNIGAVAERLERTEEAIEAFEGFLAARPDSELRADIERRLRALRRER